MRQLTRPVSVFTRCGAVPDHCNLICCMSNVDATRALRLSAVQKRTLGLPGRICKEPTLTACSYAHSITRSSDFTWASFASRSATSFRAAASASSTPAM